MTKQEFQKLISERILYLDGATGSNLQKAGMPTGVCPEQWILEHEQVMIELQKAYIQAGTDIIYAPTFTANRIKLQEYGLYEELGEMNQQLVSLSKRAIEESGQLNRQIYIAGDLTMTGEQLYPIGSLMFEELIEIYKEQVTYLLMAGVDLFIVETMMSLQECRAAVLAIKEICDLPICVTLTFNEDGRTLYGTDAMTAAIVLQELGVDAVGVNCSTGPEQMCEVVRTMKAYATVPIIAKPNAGLPKLIDGKTVFDMGPEEFAKKATLLVEAGANIIGGCCGTTPEHIEKLVQQTSSYKTSLPKTEKIRALTTERNTLIFGLDGSFMIVGERINPTGKKALQAELREGSFDMVTTFAQEQIKRGASILDVNMGMNGIDEKATMLQAIYELTRVSEVPLCIDSSHVDVIEAALRIYPGRALINSISLEQEKFEKLIPIAKKYGAMFILLPLSDAGLPKDLGEKKIIIHKILDRAIACGLTKEDIVVDGLVATIGANKYAAMETMETIRYCKKELGLATICGLSNISFGLPERQFVNSTFLAFAIREGLTMAIANPNQDLLVNTAFASDLLLAKEESDLRYINQVTTHPTQVVSSKESIKTGTKTEVSKCEKKEQSLVFDEVMKGNRKHIVDIVKEELQKGTKATTILDTMLIPAINEVGNLFDQQIYFLPQLISSAETMKLAIEYLEPMLKADSDGSKLGTVVIATVEGDIHDIGKNLVALMLQNYGFEVHDLGKDVSTTEIVEAAKRYDADIIGLSALMTTTMMEMKKVVKKVKEEQLRAKVIVGGAVITQSFADEIGADGYSKDAQEAVRLVKRLLHLV